MISFLYFNFLKDLIAIDKLSSLSEHIFRNFGPVFFKISKVFFLPNDVFNFFFISIFFYPKEIEKLSINFDNLFK